MRKGSGKTPKIRNFALGEESVLGAGSLDILLAIMGHEIAQPLSAIIAYAAACEKLCTHDEIPQAQILENLEKLLAQARRATQILTKCTTLFQITPCRASVRDMVEEALSFLENEVAEAGVNIETVGLDSLHAYVDKTQVVQVIVNLVRNSLDALERVSELKKISISALLLPTDEIQISIIDSGCGISSDLVDKICLPFVTTKEGRGLGLSISKAIVEAHNGLLWIDKQATVGAHFLFTLPATEQKLAKAS